MYPVVAIYMHVQCSDQLSLNSSHTPFPYTITPTFLHNINENISTRIPHLGCRIITLTLMAKLPNLFNNYVYHSKAKCFLSTQVRIYIGIVCKHLDWIRKHSPGGCVYLFKPGYIVTCQVTTLGIPLARTPRSHKHLESVHYWKRC